MDRDALAARLRTAFLGELEEQLAAMNTGLLALERNPEDAEHLRAVFRVAHTLKGAARAAGVMPVERTCHVLESLLAPVREGGRLEPEDFTLLYAVTDALTVASATLRDGREPDDLPLSQLRDRLKERGDAARRDPFPVAGRAPLAPPSFVPPRAVPAVPAPAPIPETTPPVPAPEARLPAPPPSADGRAPGPTRQLRIDADKLDTLYDAAGELLVTAARFEERPATIEAMQDFIAKCATDWSRTDRRLRVVLEQAGAAPGLLEAMHELRDQLHHLTREIGRLATDMAADTRTLEQNAGDVAAGVQRLRLRPFAEAVESLPRVARDVGAAAGKDVTVEVVGGDVQADRAILDSLRDALVQLVRNAVDHGLELPVVREATGKPRRGVVRISATMRGERLVVAVADDGAGLDLGAVSDALRRRGVEVPADERELAHHLFAPGLSTRHEVGAISGRGVGLDIVRVAMQRIRGTVDVTWVPGRGTTFTLECPPTLATFRALLVRLGTQVVALPTSHVARLLRLPAREVRQAEGRDIISTVDGPVPVIPLHRLLPPITGAPLTDPLVVVLLSSGTRRLAVVVDELIAEQPVVLRPLRHRGDSLPLISGAAILGRGHIALVLNPGATIDAGLAAGATGGLDLALVAPTGPTRPRVLVVDDSITTRTLEQSILETAGYDVLAAVDGADAWRLLQERGVDLVLSDVEMPRMDGFALCEAIRASTRFRTLPVVLVSALETPEHRARGLAAGADAYIGKSAFDQQNLLNTVHQLLDREDA